MAKPKHDWAWKRLSVPTAPRRPLNWRRPDFMTNAQGMTVRFHIPHPTTPAIERFLALTERRIVGDDTCVIWKGGDKFRADEFTVVSPARFYWEMMLGEKLANDEVLYRACKTPGCVKHKVKRRNMA